MHLSFLPALSGKEILRAFLMRLAIKNAVASFNATAFTPKLDDKLRNLITKNKENSFCYVKTQYKI
jgi:hypothetical protein